MYLTQGTLLIPYGERSLKERLAAKEPLGQWDENLYWHTGGADRLQFYRRSFADWQALGLDGNSRIADPQFVDAGAHDFRLQPGSPALELGFQPFDISTVGLYGDPAWANEVRHADCPCRPLPPAPPPPAPLSVNDDFENTPAGNSPAHARVSGEENGASIRVSADRAASGRQSLKVTDAAATQPSWQPHFYYEPHMTEGVVRHSFRRLDGPRRAVLHRVARRRRVSAERRPQRAIRRQRQGDRGWPSARADARSDVVPRRDRSRAGQSRAAHVSSETHSRPAGATQTFAGLPISGTEFRELVWLGYSSTAAADTVFYLDNVTFPR